MMKTKFLKIMWDTMFLWNTLKKTIWMINLWFLESLMAQWGSMSGDFLKNENHFHTHLFILDVDPSYIPHCIFDHSHGKKRINLSATCVWLCSWTKQSIIWHVPFHIWNLKSNLLIFTIIIIMVWLKWIMNKIESIEKKK